MLLSNGAEVMTASTAIWLRLWLATLVNRSRSLWQLTHRHLHSSLEIKFKYLLSDCYRDEPVVARRV